MKTQSEYEDIEKVIYVGWMQINNIDNLCGRASCVREIETRLKLVLSDAEQQKILCCAVRHAGVEIYAPYA